MANRAQDWFAQAEYDLKLARTAQSVGSHEWACFAAQQAADVPFNERPSDWDRSNLPVPTDILVYTAVEWRQVVARGDRFARVMSTEVTWVHP